MRWSRLVYERPWLAHGWRTPPLMINNTIQSGICRMQIHEVSGIKKGSTTVLLSRGLKTSLSHAAQFLHFYQAWENRKQLFWENQRLVQEPGFTSGLQTIPHQIQPVCSETASEPTNNQHPPTANTQRFALLVLSACLRKQLRLHIKYADTVQTITALKVKMGKTCD